MYIVSHFPKNYVCTVVGFQDFYNNIVNRLKLGVVIIWIVDIINFPLP